MGPQQEQEHRTEETEWRDYYKWLLGGACALVVCLTGALVGLWARGIDERFADHAEQIKAHWRTLSERDRRITSLESDARQLKAETADQELRLRVLERRR